MAGLFFYGYNYYQDEYQGRVAEANLKGELARSAPAEKVYDPNYHPSLLVGEVVIDDNDIKKWRDLYFLQSQGQHIFLVETAHNLAYSQKPVASSKQLFYYELNTKSDDLQDMILRSFDFASSREEKVIAPTDDFYPLGVWVSPNGEKLIYLRAFKETSVYTYWNYRIRDGVTKELMNAAAGYYPVPYQQWNQDSERFYFTEEVGDNSYVLQESRGSIISPAFPVVNWDKLDWSDMWEVKPLAVSPDGLATIYLDRHSEGDLVEKTDVNIVDQGGGTTNLISLPGNIYELVWSPDGKMIAFNTATHSQDGERQKPAIWIMESNGDNPVKVYEAAGDGLILQDLQWSKDSKEVYFIERYPREYSLVQVVQVATGGVKTLQRHLSGDDRESYLRILQYLEVPKTLEWQDIGK